MRATATLRAQGEGSDALAFVFAGLVAAIVLLPVDQLLDLKLAALGLGVPLLCAALAFRPREAWLEPALAAWRWAAVAVALYALAFQLGPRATGSFGNAGYFAAFLILSWPLWLERGRWAVALLLGALLLTGSRAALLALAAQAALLAWRRPALRRPLLGWGLLLLAAAAFVLGREGLLRPTLRLELWRQTLGLALQKPWMGWGHEPFVLATEGRWSGALAQALAAGNQVAEHPHQLLLSVFFHRGLFGLLQLGLVVAGILLLLRARRDDAGRALALGLLGLLVQAQFDRFFFHAGLAGLFLLVLGTQARLTLPRWAWAGAFVVALLFAWMALDPLLAWRRAVVPAAQLGPAPAAAPKLAGGSQDPADWDQRGTALASQGVYHEAAGAFREALRLQPSSGRAQNLGNSLFAQGLFKEAEAAYREAIRLDPRSADAHFSLGYALFRQKRLKDAVASLDTALRLHPRHAEAATLKAQILR